MIYFRNTTRRHRVASRRVGRSVRGLLAAVGRPDAALSVSLIGDTAMRRLNREHRGKDRTTDVLSFPLFEPFAAPAARDDAGPEVLLGDIVISLDATCRQAAAYDAPLYAEIERLLVHGVLHLLGHDHEERGERARMRREERRLAAAIGLPWPYRADAS